MTYVPSTADELIEKYEDQAYFAAWRLREELLRKHDRVNASRLLKAISELVQMGYHKHPNRGAAVDGVRGGDAIAKTAGASGG